MSKKRDASIFDDDIGKDFYYFLSQSRGKLCPKSCGPSSRSDNSEWMAGRFSLFNTTSMYANTCNFDNKMFFFSKIIVNWTFCTVCSRSCNGRGYMRYTLFLLYLYSYDASVWHLSLYYITSNWLAHAQNEEQKSTTKSVRRYGRKTT